MSQKKKPVVVESPEPKLSNYKKPILVLTGVAVVITVIVASCDSSDDDAVVDVQRTHYATQEACLADWNNPADCQMVADEDSVASAASDASVAQALAATSDTTGSSDGGGGVGGGGGGYHGVHYVGGGWYGPYFTRTGTIYHSNGLHTTGTVPTSPHGDTTFLSMRSTSLDSGSSAFSHTPRSVSVSESRAISRGGFMSAHGGEGGGHGFGGSRGG
jgi:hypothetical protein